MTLTLSSEVNAGTIVVDGPSATIDITRVGQRGYLTFNGTAGQKVSLGLNSSTISTSSDLWIYNPDGSTLTGTSILNLNGSNNNFHMTLPATGTYTIMVDPDATSTGSVTLTLSSEVDAGTIVVDGASVTMTLSRVGQRGWMTFSGTAGQFVSLGVNSTTLFSTSVLVIYKPDGSALANSGTFLDTNDNFHLALPATGTYAILIDPNTTSTGSVTLTLSSEVDAGTIVVDGTSVTGTMTRIGQRARMTFSGTAGQIVSLGVNSTTLSSTSSLNIYNPDGSALANSGTFLNTDDNFHLTLPATGTYTILIDPAGTSTGSVTLTLSSEINAPIVLDGASMTATFTRVGQRARMTFSGTTGQIVSLGVNSTTLSSTSSLNIYNPDGSALANSGTFLNTDDNFHLALPATGTYTILVDPANTSTGSVTLTLSSEVTGTLTINGGSVPVTISRVGQRARLTFSGTASQQATVRITGNTMGSVNVALYKPDGTQQTSTTSNASSFNLATQTLPATGTYTIFVDPANINSGSMNVSVTSP